VLHLRGHRLRIFSAVGFIAACLPSTGKGDSWTPTATTGAPAGRVSQVSVWTGSKVIVWGGTANLHNGTDFSNTGGMYDPIANSWVPTTTTGVPTQRDACFFVWTGTEMIVWGGEGYNGKGTKFVLLNTGGQFDPAAGMNGRWTATATTGAPSPRRSDYLQNPSPPAVWTGSRMIVWGGDAFGTLLGDGGQYDPVSNTWTAVSSNGAPSPRFRHSAAWTGSKMIIWGGEDNNGASNDGALYDPVAGEWTPMSTVGAPSPRSGHSTVFTGSDMIVFGGYDGANYLDDGGQYNPVQDTWTPFSSASAPSARTGHTAVWTGTEMIVWGGYDGVNALDTGGLYNPVSDTWAATTTIDSPTPRYYHTAVFTGTEMVIWGGRTPAGGPFLNTGGIYTP
jgi:N-acetylneuraminic acid mutarotase